MRTRRLPYPPQARKRHEEMRQHRGQDTMLHQTALHGRYELAGGCADPAHPRY